MKDILMFTMASCPFCKRTRKDMKKLLEENPEYKNIPIKIIDETLHPIKAGKYDYWLVPTFYIDGMKIHEGAATYGDVKKIFDLALKG